MTVKDSVYIGLFAAITAVLGIVPKIDLPGIPVPITAQLLGIMLAGSILGAWRGFAAIAVFLALVAAGLPLLPGGRGGLGVFFGPTAGYLFAFPVGAFFIGWLTERFWYDLNFVSQMVINLVGSSLVLAGGVAGLVLLSGYALNVAAYGQLQFLPGDVIKAAIAASVAMFVRRGYPLLAHPKTRSAS